MAKVTLHVLHSGTAIGDCVKGIPRDWPEGHAWIRIAEARGISDAAKRDALTSVLCAPCFEMFERLDRERKVKP